MAQKTIPRPTAGTSDVEFGAQTRLLFHRVVHDSTKSGRDSALNARAFQQVEDQDPRHLFGPDSAVLNSVVDCLHKHAENMRNDSHLQRAVQKLRNDVSYETLWRVCKKMFERVGDIWTGVLTIFAFGLELCRQMVVDIYDYIANTITAVIVNLAADWITGQGGWLALVCNGVVGVAAQGVNWMFAGGAATGRKALV